MGFANLREKRAIKCIYFEMYSNSLYYVKSCSTDYISNTTSQVRCQNENTNE